MTADEIDRPWDVEGVTLTDPDDPRFGRLCPGRCGEYLGMMQFRDPHRVVEWRGEWWHKPCARSAAVWEVLGKARVMIWFCPDREVHGQEPGRQTVEWRENVAHCLHPGCGRTSGDPS